MIAYGSWFIQNFHTVLTGIIGVGCVIAFHELGHLLFCKLFNVHVPTFSIGFGPRILNKKIGETTFSLSLIPVGGYVEAEMGQTPGLGDDRNMEKKPYWQKMCIAFGGIFFNLIFAFIVLVGLSMTGIPSNPFLMKKGSYAIKKFAVDSPAQKAGLKTGDTFLKINDTDISENISQLFQALEPLANKPATVTVQRDGTPQTFPLTLGSRKIKDKEIGALGIEEFLFPSYNALSFGASITQAFTITSELIVNTAKGLAHAFQKRSAQRFYHHQE